MKRLRSILTAGGCALAVSACSQLQAPPADETGAVIYEAARLITGDGRIIEDSAFLVENGRVTTVGSRGELAPRVAANRVTFSGKTIIPGLIDAHAHIGYMKHLTSGALNYTHENILDHLYRFSYFGVVAAQSMGTDFGELPYQIRQEVLSGKYADAARFLTAGRGLAPLPEISADNMRQAAFVVTTPAGARASVQELAGRNVTLVKTWVDDRGGRVEMMSPALYGALIDEAHEHGVRVAVHATDPGVAKDLLRAGVDVFAHMISDVDDELIELFAEHPDATVLSALAGPHRAVYAPWLHPAHPLIVETILPDQVTRLQGRFPLKAAAQTREAQQAWDRLANAVDRLHRAGVRIGVGTDGGGQQGDQFLGWTMHTELENLVMAGMPPADALAAGTRVNAEILGQTDLGTIAPGKRADFVVLDASPLDDITNTRRIHKVFLGGREVDREALRERFAGRESPH